MIVTLVHVFVKSGFIDDFIEATRINHENSIREPGNLRFDILQDANDPGKFILYEAYATPEAVTAHKDTLHYTEWRDTVAPWMEKLRDGVKYNLLFPSDSK